MCAQGEIILASQIVHFAKLSDRDLKIATFLPKLAAGDRLKLQVCDAGGKQRTLPIPPSAAEAAEALLAPMLRAERVDELAEDHGAICESTTPGNTAAFLKDVPALKSNLDTRQTAMEALSENTTTCTRLIETMFFIPPKRRHDEEAKQHSGHPRGMWTSVYAPSAAADMPRTRRQRIYRRWGSTKRAPDVRRVSKNPLKRRSEACFAEKYHQKTPPDALCETDTFAIKQNDALNRSCRYKDVIIDFGNNGILR